MSQSPVVGYPLDTVLVPADFTVMRPLEGDKPHFLGPPRKVGGQPRSLDCFNHNPGAVSFGQFDPALFPPGDPIFFSILVKKRHTTDHHVPTNRMSGVSRMALQQAMDYHAITHGEKALRNSYGKLEFLACWVPPGSPAHPGEGNFRPVVNHTDEGEPRFLDKIGFTSSNYTLATGMQTRHVSKAFSALVTEENIDEQISHMRHQSNYHTLPEGRQMVWDGAHSHAAGINNTGKPLWRTFRWLSYSDGAGQSRKIKEMASKNPVLGPL